ncbi:hypothetical protein D3227_04790 [Mesorhizobium waimense]|uniref:Uncharacterized protein n=1 Tax=Mesorhizobium waimense TaxID=1300307 RepID=A0A3A5L1I4_9HYPH|nr:hypothetical protein [Mesorhizobium waimense]RJT41999.1 hypothetical protein D3227_04790 [Mesorhizobium waimense]
MGAWAMLCILLSIAFGVSSAASLLWVATADIEKRVDAWMIAALLAAASLISFVLALWFAIANAAQGLA